MTVPSCKQPPPGPHDGGSYPDVSGAWLGPMSLSDGEQLYPVPLYTLGSYASRSAKPSALGPWLAKWTNHPVAC